MKPLLAFIAGVILSDVLLVASCIATGVYCVISVFMNSGHPCPHDPVLLFGAIPAGFFLVFTTTLFFLCRSISLVQDWLKEKLFYLGFLFGCMAFAFFVVLIIHFHLSGINS